MFLKATRATLKRLLVVEPFVTYGFPNLKNVKELIYKKGRGFLDKEPFPLTSNDLIEKFSCLCCIYNSGSTAPALSTGIPQVVCPFLLDQFYWAERVHWLGVASEPLQRQHLIPDTDNASSINNAADVLLGAIKLALSPEIKAQATIIADRLSSEDGIGEALRILKEKVLPQNKI